MSLDDVLSLSIDEATSIGHLLERQGSSIPAQWYAAAHAKGAAVSRTSPFGIT